MKQRKRNTLEVPIAAPTPAATNADIERQRKIDIEDGKEGGMGYRAV